jgi:hypothetical protein
MKLTGAIQESLLILLAFDDSPRGAKLIRSLVPLKAFGPYYRDLAEEILLYLERYKEPPGDHLIDIIEALCAEHEDRAEIYERIRDSILKTKDHINREYVIDQASIFTRQQNLKRSIQEALELLETDTPASLIEAENVVASSSERSVDLLDVGTFLSDPSKSLQFLEKEEEAFPTGIPELDAYSLGPARKTLHLFSALPNRGKTWWLLQLAKMAMLLGLRVLHITLEMSEGKIARRCLQSIFSVAKRKEPVDLIRFERDDLGRLVHFEYDQIKGRPALLDTNVRKSLLRNLKKIKRRAPILIKEFPTGALSVQELRAYLDALEGRVNFIPDLLLVDYADLSSGIGGGAEYGRGHGIPSEPDGRGGSMGEGKTYRGGFFQVRNRGRPDHLFPDGRRAGVRPGSPLCGEGER